LKDTLTMSVRMPAELQARIKQAAEASRRSINSQIVFELEKVFNKDYFRTIFDKEVIKQ